MVIARDMRPSGPALVDSFSRGVMEQGVDVVDIGLASTDLMYFASGTLDLPLGARDGSESVFVADENEKLKARIAELEEIRLKYHLKAHGVGGGGKGVLVVRQDDNSWSNPAFITLTGGSVGWQIGAESADVILVFRMNQPNGPHERVRLDLPQRQAMCAFEFIYFQRPDSRVDGRLIHSNAGEATKIEDQVPIKTPNIIANAKPLMTSIRPST